MLYFIAIKSLQLVCLKVLKVAKDISLPTFDPSILYPKAQENAHEETKWQI